MNLEYKYEKLIEKHNNRSISGKARAYFFGAKKMKELIKELREDAKDIKIKFMASLNCPLDFLVSIDTNLRGRPVRSSSSSNSRLL